MTTRFDPSSQESNLKLIKEIRKRPCLYNKSLMSYGRKSIHDKGWEEVAQIMGWKVAQCRDRWRNLRSVYFKHIKRLTAGERTRPYYLMNVMRFALPHFKSLNQKELPSELFEVTKEEGCEEVEDQEEEQCDFQRLDTLSPNHDASRESLPQPEQTFVTICGLPTPNSQIRKEDVSQALGQPNRASMQNVTRNSSMDIQVEVSDTVSNLELQNDAKKMFLLSLLPDVYAMTDVQMRTFKRRVLNLIGSILEDSESSTYCKLENYSQ